MISIHQVQEIVRKYPQQIVSIYRIADNIYQQLNIQSMMQILHSALEQPQSQPMKQNFLLHKSVHQLIVYT